MSDVGKYREKGEEERGERVEGKTLTLIDNNNRKKTIKGRKMIKLSDIRKHCGEGAKGKEGKTLTVRGDKTDGKRQLR